jgi:hypothetical protein
MLPTSQVVGMSSERTCTSFHSLLTNCSSDVNTTAEWEHKLFECLGENVGLHSVIIPKRVFNIRFSSP